MTWRGYGLALLGVVLALGAREALGPLFSDRAVLLLFVPAVLFAAAVGGAGPGLAAAALSLMGALLINRAGILNDPRQLAEALLFAVLTPAIAYGGWRLQRQSLRASEALAHLAQREDHLQSILDTVHDAMVVIDDQGQIQSFSHRAEELFGWTASEVVGRNVSLLMPQPYRDAHDSYLARYLQTGERRIIGIGRVVVGERQDGSTFPMELAIGEMHSQTHRYFTGFVRDLSETQSAERRLQDLQAELVHVSRLTALGEMASALAHELNQPLSAISNYVGGSIRILDQSTPDIGRVRGALVQAGQQALRAGDIIRRLRDFVSKGDTERRIEPLSQLVEEACALSMIGAKEHGIRLQIALSPTVQRVLADKVQIQQVILNLLRNAIEAMQDSPRRELLVASAPGADETVVITVTDTGPGIAPEVQAQLFQPFVTSKSQGMGVGLSISRTIIEAHGGRIWAESTPQGGTMFSFSLRTVPDEELSLGD